MKRWRKSIRWREREEKEEVEIEGYQQGKENIECTQC